MRKIFAICILLLFVSCTHFDEYAQLENKNAAHKIGMLKFKDKRDLWNAINGDEYTSRTLIEQAESNVIDSLKFISLTSAIPVQIAAYDPILSVEGSIVNIDWDSKGLRYPRKSMYRVLGYDTLVPNITFAQILNARGEVAVNDTIYKVSPKGTYFYEESLQHTFEANYGTYENIEGTLIADNLVQVDDGIYRYATYDDVDVSEYSNDDMPAELPSEATDTYQTPNAWDDTNSLFNIQSEPITGPNRNNFSIPWREFPVYEAGAQTGFGEFWENIIGRNRTFTTQLSNKRRVKGKFYYYNYVVYCEIGTMVQMQKKQWLGWSGTLADNLFMGWNNIIFENGYEEIPTYPQKPTPRVAGLTVKSIPGIGGLADVLTVVGLELTDSDQSTLSTMLPNQLQAWLSLRISNYRGNYNIENIDVIEFYSASKVVTLLTNGFVYNENVEKLKYSFLKDWGFYIELDLLNMPSNMLDWANTLNAKDLLIKPKHLKYGAVYLAGQLDGQWGGMTIIKN